MAKSKQKKSSKNRLAEEPKKSSPLASREEQAEANARWWREAIESIVVAIVLALLFRTFEAEAFVIPTGSMAPTLQGRHKDVECKQCGHRYRGGASEDNERGPRGTIEYTVCPMCRYPTKMDVYGNHNHDSFTGDRILVNKFVYQFGDPERWDVIVFKFPGNAKQNYIKRLVGLPGETLRIWHGDIYTQRDGEDSFTIERKPPYKLTRMLQLVHDTDYTPKALIDIGWPARWQSPESRRGDSDAKGWTVSEDRKSFSLEQDSSRDEAWLRYRHIVPTVVDWQRDIERGQVPTDMQYRRGELISDFYAYNACLHQIDRPDDDRTGFHWVGDLAVECELDVLSNSGEIVLDLVEGGRHFQCRVNVADGMATLMIDGGQIPFSHQASDSPPPYTLTQETKVRGPGLYELRFANVDDQLLLWVDNSLVQFDASGAEHPGAFDMLPDNNPQWSLTDPGDLAPVRIAGKDIAMTASRLRVLRDVYYVATSHRPPTPFDYDAPYTDQQIRSILRTPDEWAQTDLFKSRRYVEFQLGEDHFFPLGDNSPQSKDARLWSQEYHPRVGPFFERNLLTGKAFLIYWPHPWYAGTRALPVIPDVPRMGLIR